MSLSPRSLWQRLMLRLGSHFSPEESGREMEEELRYHLEREAERNVAKGMPPEEAHGAARRAFGNVAQAAEDMRQASRWGWLARLQCDVRHAARSLRRVPAFSVTVILTIALALGLNATVFTIFNAYVLRPLAVRDPQTLYDLSLVGGRGTEQWTESWMDWEDYRALAASSTALTDVVARRHTYLRIDGTPSYGELVSGNFFRMLGVGASRGRPLLPSDAAAFGEGAVLVLSHRIWQTRYGSDPAILGRIVSIRGYPFTVVGVMPKSFTGLTELPVDFWAPITMVRQFEGNAERLGAKALPRVGVLGRLRPGFAVQRAEALLGAWAAGVSAGRPEEQRIVGVRLARRATAIPISPELILIVTPIGCAFVLIMIIACANVANMMLARGLTRQREIGIRLALGAGRRQVILQLLTEAVLLSMPAAALGYLLSRATVDLGVRWLLATVPPVFSSYMRMVPLTPDLRVFGFLLLAAMASAVLFGLAPALQVTRPGVIHATRGEFDSGRRPARLRNTLVVAQIAACLLLLVVAGVLLRGSGRVQRLELGFHTAGVVQIEANDLKRDRVLDVLRGLPVVRSVAAAAWPPSDGVFGPVSLVARGRAAVEPVYFNRVTPEYFADLGIPLVRGRTFSSEESRDGDAVVILSETAARRLLGLENPLGREVQLAIDDAEIRQRELGRFRVARIIGVAGDAVAGCVCTNRRSAVGYYPASLRAPGTRLLVSVTGIAESAKLALDSAVERLVPGGVEEVHTLDESVAVQVYPFRAAYWVSSVLGTIALLLTVSGIYGVLSYLVTHRTREIGIRMALGADSSAVVGLVLRQSLRMAAIGGAIGLVLALGVSRIFASQLEIMNTFDLVAYFGSAVIALAACVVAAWRPSRRAARVDPAHTLRED